jgi:tRNA A-37 threonylcarbamoyl transferase component Bud32
VAICLYGSHAGGYAGVDSDFDVVLVLDNYSEGAGFQTRGIGQVDAAILVVDRDLFELDMKKGHLGEFICARLLGPYVALENPSFLKEMEIHAKRRIVQEELNDLVIEFQKMSHGLMIDPTYFALSRLRKRARHYPSLLYSYTNMLREDLRHQNLRLILEGYRVALQDFRKADLIRFESDMVMLQARLIDKVLTRSSFERAVNVAETSQRVFRSYLAYGRSRIGGIELILDELGALLRRGPQFDLHEKPEDPRNHLFLQTSTGMVNLNEQSSIIDVARRLRPGARVVVTPLASVLNDVYLVSMGQEQLVAKRYTDWVNLKWFTVNLVTLGTKKFSVMGKSRLANEYGMNRVLSAEDVPVPEIVHVSIPHRILMERYIEGENVGNIVKAASSSDQLTAREYETAIAIGKALAKIHSVDITVGDSKPENFLSCSDGRVYSLDLEQAAKKGDKAWDVSEFLFYSGHYSPLMTQGLSQFVDGFIQGYSEAGERNILRRAAGLNYLKVFSIWTAPPVIYRIADRLRKV